MADTCRSYGGGRSILCDRHSCQLLCSQTNVKAEVTLFISVSTHLTVQYGDYIDISTSCNNVLYTFIGVSNCVTVYFVPA